MVWCLRAGHVERMRWAPAGGKSHVGELEKNAIWDGMAGFDCSLVAFEGSYDGGIVGILGMSDGILSTPGSSMFDVLSEAIH